MIRPIVRKVGRLWRIYAGHFPISPDQFPSAAEAADHARRLASQQRLAAKGAHR